MRKSILRSLSIVCGLLCFFPIVIFIVSVQSGIFWIYLLIASLPSLLLTLYIVYFIKRRIIKPLQFLNEAAVKISAGDLSQPICYKKQDEIGYFAETFEEMRQTLYQQKEAQQTFEVERKNFIDSISHDLKTPLASISAYIEALQDGVASSPEEEQQYLQVMENKVATLTELSSYLSKSYQLPETLPLTFEKVNCFEWTQQFFQEMRLEGQLNQKTLQFENKLSSEDKATVMMDVIQFRRGVENIVSNAFRYSQNCFGIQCERKQDQFIISIANDGVTVKSHEVDKIFQRFYTGEKVSNQGHLGLGLAISRTIIEGMQGQIQAEIVDRVIVFKISLPIV